MAAIVMLLSVGFVYCSGFTAFAAVDLDVTIVPPPESVQNNGNCPVELDIVTKSANGYVELVINIEYDADLLALATESLAVNITNSKLAYVFACQDKTVAESFKKMFDQINEGNPAAGEWR